MKARYVVLIVLLSMLLLFGMFFGIFAFLMKMMKGEAYEISLHNLYSNTEITTLIGAPIEPGFFVMGSINTSGGSGSADISYSVTGTNTSAEVFVLASKKFGMWNIDQQVVQIAGASSPIYLVGGSSSELNQLHAY